MRQKILLFCLCLSTLLSPSLSAQEEMHPDQTESGDSTYVFSKATLVIFNYKTRDVVENITITDPALIDSTDFHLSAILLKATIREGAIYECMLPGRKWYKVEENMLIPIKKVEKDKKEDNELLQEEKFEEQLPDNNTAEEEVLEPRPLMLYNLTIADDTATIEFQYPFGDSRYKFSLEAILTISLTKQETPQK